MRIPICVCVCLYFYTVTVINDKYVLRQWYVVENLAEKVSYICVYFVWNCIFNNCMIVN